MNLQLFLEAAADPGLEGIEGGEDEETSSPRRVAGGLVEIEEEGSGEGGQREARGEHHQTSVRILHQVRHHLLLESKHRRRPRENPTAFAFFPGEAGD